MLGDTIMATRSRSFCAIEEIDTVPMVYCITGYSLVPRGITEHPGPKLTGETRGTILNTPEYPGVPRGTGEHRVLRCIPVYPGIHRSSKAFPKYLGYPGLPQSTPEYSGMQCANVGGYTLCSGI
jgi:hypothetical protein